MNDYELVILTATDYGKKVADDVQKAVGDKKKVTKTDDWGVKQLAYPIKKQSEAAYFLFTLTLEPAEVSPLDESLRRNENVLRHLLVKSDKKKAISNKKETQEKTKKEIKKGTRKGVVKKKK